MSGAPERAFRIDVPFHLIQSFRLCHALAESDFELVVPQAEAENFAYLRRFFPIRYIVGDHAPLLQRVRLSHEEPRTEVGSIVRPLLFAHGIVDRCRSKWADERPVAVSFRGLVTPARAAVLRAWEARSARLGGVVIEESRRGREFPVKVWDDGYYDLLAISEHVLCPNGDFVWTYRFFEAMLCGAVPLVEQEWSLYDGFHYGRMGEDGELRWSRELAEENFRRTVELLTVPLATLNDVLSEELDRASV